MMRSLLRTEASKALQENMGTVIAGVDKVLSVPEEQREPLRRAGSFAKRFVVEVCKAVEYKDPYWLQVHKCKSA